MNTREELIEQIKQAGHEAAEGMIYPYSDYPVKAIPYTRFLEILHQSREAHILTADDREVQAFVSAINSEGFVLDRRAVRIGLTAAYETKGVS